MNREIVVLTVPFGEGMLLKWEIPRDGFRPEEAERLVEVVRSLAFPAQIREEGQ